MILTKTKISQNQTEKYSANTAALQNCMFNHIDLKSIIAINCKDKQISCFSFFGGHDFNFISGWGGGGGGSLLSSIIIVLNGCS